MRLVPLLLTIAATAACKSKSDQPRAGSAVATTANGSGSAGSNDGVAGPSARPSTGTADPDYPTPAAAGTDQIFLLEEPERGEKIPTTYDLKPKLAGLTWTTHAFCVRGALDVACSERATPANWRVGRKGKEVVVAIPASPRELTMVYLAKPDGTPERYYEIDAYNRVRAGGIFHADRYTSRRSTGGNDLAGCGEMAYSLIPATRHVQKLSCMQWSGDPMLDTRGVASTRFVRDARGFVKEAHFEDLQGRPTMDVVDHVAAKVYELDRDGRQIGVRFRDPSGQPVASASGCHGYRWTLAANNAVTQEWCIDETGRTTAATSGVAITKYDVDARGCRTGYRYFDADESVTHEWGIHGQRIAVDKFCAEKSRTCIGVTNGARSCGVSRPAKYVTKRDAFGMATSIKHYNGDDTPGEDEDYGIFEIRYKYDDLGRFTHESCWDTEGAPVLCGTTGLHETRSKYDDAGRIVEERYYDVDGEVTTNYGTTIRRFVYDNYDHQFEETNHDASGTLIDVNGQAIRRDLYDTSHRSFGILLLDKGGNPASYEGCYTGVTCPDQNWHAIRLVRQPDGRVEKSIFFDTDQQLIQTFDCREDQCFE